jgi:hypothetical protein
MISRNCSSSAKQSDRDPDQIGHTRASVSLKQLVRHSAGRSSPAPNGAPPERRLAKMGRTTTTGGINSWNCSAEGPTDHPRIVELRSQQSGNAAPVAAGSHAARCRRGSAETKAGTAMPIARITKSAGLIGRAWVRKVKTLLSFRKLILLRRAHIVFHRHRFLHGQTIPGTEVKGIVWLRPDGAERGRMAGQTGERKRSWCGSAASSGSCI